MLVFQPLLIHPRTQDVTPSTTFRIRRNHETIEPFTGPEPESQSGNNGAQFGAVACLRMRFTSRPFAFKRKAQIVSIVRFENNATAGFGVRSAVV